MSSPTTNPAWLGLPPGHPYGLATLPYATFTTADDPAPRLGVRIGDRVLDVPAAARNLAPELLPTVDAGLDGLLAASSDAWSAVRSTITAWFTDPRTGPQVEALLYPLRAVTPHLPFTPADYVDFYASEQHATNLGRIFRPGQEPLTPNWKHLPIGYHGRAGTLVLSGTDIVRPAGQHRLPDGTIGTGPTARLDIEAELGFVVGTPSELGRPVPLKAAGRHIFGVSLVNDWSARDIQAWEYVPLGPFLGKSFATSLSPWVVPLEALAGARVTPPERTHALSPYLDDTGLEPWGFDIDFEVLLNGHLIATPAYADMYWTPAQMLAHLTANGASLRSGDFFASGTVSGPQHDQRGSLIELTWGGTEPLHLPGGSTRTFLEDGDEVVITATARGPHGSRLGLGEVRGRIVPAREV
ncbi:fumarylacetoacetase [Streptomyces iranensis]|uniref:fumarylacetoacetase n=1 Tax=Streptomyces iranensis TaxID=576784 RepID=UPI0039B7270D